MVRYTPCSDARIFPVSRDLRWRSCWCLETVSGLLKNGPSNAFKHLMESRKLSRKHKVIRWDRDQDMYIILPGSSWSWKFPRQSQNRSILPNSREKSSWTVIPLQNVFFPLQKASERFWMLLYRFLNVFSTPQRPKCPGRQKPLRCSFFHTNPQNRSFLGLELKIPVIVGKLQVYNSLL